ERRLQNIMERLNMLSMELSPPGPTVAAGSVASVFSAKTKLYIYSSHISFSSSFKTCLFPTCFQRGEVLRIIRKTGDGWWLAQDTEGNKGVVPKTYLKVINLLKIISGAVHLIKHSGFHCVCVCVYMSQSDTTNVLSSLGTIHSGFRSSTFKLLMEEGHYTLKQPELSQSQLSFRDLFLDPVTGRVRGRQVRTCVCFTLWSCRMIPTPGVGVQVLSRHIRLCAFDGTQVLSNIHTVRATYNAKSPKTWSFSPRMTGILPTLLDGDCFLRCNSVSPDLGILFELGVTFIRTSTGDRGDLSCGWAFLKLTDDTGNPLSSRTYELALNGGTPFEKNVPVEASVTTGSPSGVFQQILQARRQPKLIVKLKSVNRRTRMQLSLLPDTLLHCLSCIPLLVLHRQLLADTLLMDRPTMQNADLICSPVLSTFPVLLDQPDLLDALRSAWLDADTNMSRAQKRDLSYLKQEFVKVYMSSVYFLLHTPSLPCHRWADSVSEEQRARFIYATLDSLKHTQHTADQSGGPEFFVNRMHQHLAFDITELTFDLLRVAR
uniref:Nephronophthisis 1 n=1 Tax=Mastacembelus armatus TaxID=205130 RepID=A0A7N9ASV4_9TELE